jgi:hypothetical protein
LGIFQKILFKTPKKKKIIHGAENEKQKNHPSISALKISLL